MVCSQEASSLAWCRWGQHWQLSWDLSPDDKGDTWSVHRAGQLHKSLETKHHRQLLRSWPSVPRPLQWVPRFQIPATPPAINAQQSRHFTAIMSIMSTPTRPLLFAFFAIPSLLQCFSKALEFKEVIAACSRCSRSAKSSVRSSWTQRRRRQLSAQLQSQESTGCATASKTSSALCAAWRNASPISKSLLRFCKTPSWNHRTLLSCSFHFTLC